MSIQHLIKNIIIKLPVYDILRTYSFVIVARRRKEDEICR
jgi:hypothetical protein